MSRREIPEVENPSLIIDDLFYKQAQDNPDAHLRMIEGAEKYGKSWAIVDLKTDLLEECLDELNYLLLMAVRIHHTTEGGITLEDWELITHVREQVKDMILIIEARFPEFSGPTSAEYIKNL